MAETTLQIQSRDTGGTPVVRAVVAAGWCPASSTAAAASRPFQVDVPSLREALRATPAPRDPAGAGAGRGPPTPALLKDYQLDPVRDRLTHIDLLAISMTEMIMTPVAVHFEGEAPGVTDDGGVLEQPLHELEVEALPANLPDAIIVDISTSSRATRSSSPTSRCPGAWSGRPTPTPSSPRPPADDDGGDRGRAPRRPAREAEEPERSRRRTGGGRRRRRRAR